MFQEFQEIIPVINSHIGQTFERERANLSTAIDKDLTGKVLEAMQYSLSLPGKRIRPALFLKTLSFLNVDYTKYMDIAIALEALHTYSLIHDDLPAMDNDDLRRGKPTNHKVYGEAMAILAGDALLTFSFDLISRSQATEAQKVRLIQEFTKRTGHRGMIQGQSLDIQSEELPDLHSLCLLKEIHNRKTADLITASVVMAAIVANADENTYSALEHFSKNIGLGFQVIDDILDLTSTTETMGKTVKKDQSTGKLTYPNLIGLDESRKVATTLKNESFELLKELGATDQDFLWKMTELVFEREY